MLRGTATILALVICSVVVGCGTDGPDDSADIKPVEITDALSSLRGGVAFDFKELNAEQNLNSVSRQSDIVGSGSLVDVREAFVARYGKLTGGGYDDVPYMLLVIEVEGTTGNRVVHVLQAAPPQNDPESPFLSVEELSDAFRQSAPRVAFMLDAADPPLDAQLLDEFAGRTADDPVYEPTHPSALLVLDGDVAYPLLTGEVVDASPQNLAVMAELNAPVSTFAAASEFGREDGSSSIALPSDDPSP